MKAVYLLVIACYVALLWATGFLVTRRSRSSDAYLLASRSLSVPLVSVLVAGTWIGGVSVVGMAQGAYIHGVSALWFQAGVWIAMFVTALLLHKIVEGAADKSYGIHVARLAGVPREVIERSKDILLQLEEEHLDAEGRAKIARPAPPQRRGQLQLTLFGPADHPLLDDIRQLDPNQLTPLDALGLVHKWQEQLKTDKKKRK